MSGVRGGVAAGGTPEPSTRVYPEVQVVLGEADALLSLAVVELHLGAAETGWQFASEALAAYRSLRAQTQAAVALLALAECSAAKGELTAAEAYMRSALAAFREVECEVGEAEALRLLGTLRMQLDDGEGGRALLSDALRRFRALELEGMASPFGLNECLHQLGDANREPTLTHHHAASGARTDEAVDGTATLLGQPGAHGGGPPRRLPHVSGKPRAAGGRSLGSRRGGGGGARIPWAVGRRRTREASTSRTRAAALEAALDVEASGDGDGRRPSLSRQRRSQRSACFLRCSCCGYIDVVVATPGELREEP